MSSRRRRTTKLSTMVEDEAPLHPTTPLYPGWIAGNLALFTSPQASPKGVRVRRSSVYSRKTNIAKNVSGKSTSTAFIDSASKVFSPPGVKTRSRRSSMYVKPSKLSQSQLPLSAHEMAKIVRASSSVSVVLEDVKTSEVTAKKKTPAKTRKPSSSKRSETTSSTKSRRKTPAKTKQSSKTADTMKRKSVKRSHTEGRITDSKASAVNIASRRKVKSTKKLVKKTQEESDTQEDVLLTFSEMNAQLLDDDSPVQTIAVKSSQKKISSKKKGSTKSSKKPSPKSLKHLTPKDENTVIPTSDRKSKSLKHMTPKDENTVIPTSDRKSKSLKSTSKPMKGSTRKSTPKSVQKITRMSTKVSTSKPSTPLSVRNTGSKRKTPKVQSNPKNQETSSESSSPAKSSPIFSPVKNLLAMFEDYRSSAAAKISLSSPTSVGKSKPSRSQTPGFKTPLSSGKKSIGDHSSSEKLFLTPVGFHSPISSTPTTFTNIKSPGKTPVSITVKSYTGSNTSMSRTPEMPDRKRKTALTPFYSSMATKRRRISTNRDFVDSPLSKSSFDSFMSDFDDDDASLLTSDDSFSESFDSSNTTNVSSTKGTSWCSVM